jgi:hypothetical protein
MNLVQSPFYYLGQEAIHFIRELGGILLMLMEAARLTFAPPIVSATW